jgi:hypothetical protein
MPFSKMTAPDSIRRNLVEHVAVLANADAQLRYEREVPHVRAHIELVESFYDSYLPGDSVFEAAFSPEERECLAELDRKLELCLLSNVHSVSDLVAMSSWQSLIQQAGEVLATLKKNAYQAPEPTPRSVTPRAIVPKLE